MSTTVILEWPMAIPVSPGWATERVSFRTCCTELIVSTHGSGTSSIVWRSGQIRKVAASGSRATRINVAIAEARGDNLLFVPFGTQLPPFADQSVEHALRDSDLRWGYFRLLLAPGWLLANPLSWMSIRYAAFRGKISMAQVVFARRETVLSLGGCPELKSNLGFELAEQLRLAGRPLALNVPVIATDPRGICGSGT